MKNKSFTLIELLVVIVIIGILAGVIMISTSSSIDKANFAKAQTFSNAVQEELLFNLISEWTFDEGSNQAVNRAATNEDVKDNWGVNNGTIVATHEPTVKGGNECVFGKCLSFNSTESDYVDCGNNSDLNLQNEITISVWVKANSIGDFGIIGNNYWSEYTYGIRLYFSSSFRFIIYDSSGAIKDINGFVPETNVWYFLTATYNKSEETNNMKFYKNGGLIGTGYANSVHSPVEHFYIGSSRYDQKLFNGLIDEARLYSAALSSAQIKQNYIAGLDSLLSKGSILKEEYNQRIKLLGSNL